MSTPCPYHFISLQNWILTVSFLPVDLARNYFLQHRNFLHHFIWEFCNFDIIVNAIKFLKSKSYRWFIYVGIRYTRMLHICVWVFAGSGLTQVILFYFCRNWNLPISHFQEFILSKMACNISSSSLRVYFWDRYHISLVQWW